MNKALSSILVLALLAGCVSPGDAQDVAPDGTDDAAAASDLADSVDVDLLEGPFDDAWTFDVVNGTTGFFSVNLNTRMQGLVEPSACVQWTRTFPGGQTKGNGGDCSQASANIVVSVVGSELLDDQMQVFHWDGDDLVPGHYRVQVTAPIQANRLAVAIGIDNPPLDVASSPGA